MKRLAALIAVVTLAAGANAGASEPSASPRDDGRAVLATIVSSAVTEVKLCTLAVEKSQSSDIRSLCRTESADNAHAAIAGMQIAQALGDTEVKFEPTAGAPALLESLGQLSGADFDREFLLNTIEASENDEHTIRYAAEVTTERSVKRFEDAVLPTVEKNLNLAEGALRRVSEEAP